MVNRFKIGTRIGARFAVGLAILALLGAVVYRTTTELIRNPDRGGLALAQRYVPNAISLDLHQPDMDGLVALEQLKGDPTTCHIPVYVMTVNDRQQQEFQIGTIAHIQKPVPQRF